jgi:hypothetical protein
LTGSLSITRGRFVGSVKAKPPDSLYRLSNKIYEHFAFCTGMAPPVSDRTLFAGVVEPPVQSSPKIMRSVTIVYNVANPIRKANTNEVARLITVELSDHGK